MAKGIIYVMTTAVDGLVKIGKTGTESFESRMYNLEKNGYCNVTALKRKFAIEVEDYDEKEKLLYDIFSNSKISNTELYALDIDLIVQLLSSFEGTKIYPHNETKEQLFVRSAKEREIKQDKGLIPDGEYYFNRNIKGFGKTKGRAVVEDGVFKVLKGSVCAPTQPGFVPEIRKNARIENNILQEDTICTSPSSAGWVVGGRSNNGWTDWKDKDGIPIDIYRNKNK